MTPLSPLLSKRLSFFFRYYYFITVVTVGLLMVCSGCTIAWPSPTIHRIKAGETPIQDGYKDVTGISYIFFCGCIPGFLLMWLFIAYAGRKSGMLTSAVLYAVSWIVMALSSSLNMVYTARFIQGMAQTLSLVISPIYIVEISQVSLREVSGFSMQFFFNFGLLMQYGIGPYVSYHSLIYINLSVALLFFACFSVFANETPYFLLIKNHGFKAEKSLRQLRSHIQPSNEEALQNELTVIRNMMEEQERCTVWNQLKLFVLDKAMRRALIVVLGLVYLFVFSGLSQLLMFAETLFRKSKFQMGISPSISATLVGVVKLIGGFILPFLVKTFGIKIIAIITTSLASITMFLLALFYYLQDYGYNMESFFWAPLTFLLLYFFLTAVGLSFIVMHVRAEIFPPHLKATGILIQEIVNIVSLELCSLFFSQLLDAVYIPLWFFSASMLVSVFFITYNLPSSRQMTLYDIQQWLKK